VSIISGSLGIGRRLAATLMTDTVTIERESEPFLYEATGQVGHTVTTVYAGPARFRMLSQAVSEVDAGGQLLGVQSPRLDLPVVGSEGVRIGDVFTVTASESDSALVGLTGRVAGVAPITLATARRVPVEIDG
jgi:hypothetical protein